jgi:hypothetical protein
MERYIGIDVHAASCTLAVNSEKGRRLRDFPVETNGQALVEAVWMIPGRKHLVFEDGLQSAWLSSTQLRIVFACHALRGCGGEHPFLSGRHRCVPWAVSRRPRAALPARRPGGATPVGNGCDRDQRAAVRQSRRRLVVARARPRSHRILRLPGLRRAGPGAAAVVCAAPALRRAGTRNRSGSHYARADAAPRVDARRWRRRPTQHRLTARAPERCSSSASRV